MAKRKRFYTWFLEPKNDDVNEAIATETAAICEGDNSSRMILCADGKRHNLWECSEEMCKFFSASRKIGLEFNVFHKEGNGKPQNVNFLFKKKGSQKARHLLRQTGKKRP